MSYITYYILKENGAFKMNSLLTNYKLRNFLGEKNKEISTIERARMVKLLDKTNLKDEIFKEKKYI